MGGGGGLLRGITHQVYQQHFATAFPSRRSGAEDAYPASGLCMCRRQRAAIVAERARAVPPFSRYCFRIAQRKLARIDKSSG